MMAPLMIMVGVLALLSPVNSVSSQAQSHWKEVGERDLERALGLNKNNAITKNIILFVGDGNGVSTVTATRIHKGQQQAVNNGGEEYELYYETFPHMGMAKTYCVDRQVTDSAASATAYLCGVKGLYNTIAVDQSQTTKGTCTFPYPGVDSILKLAQDAGMATGIVTTTRVTHASPANLYAHSADRAWEGTVPDAEATKGCKDIAYQLVKDSPGNGIKVILGGGRMFFLPNSTQDLEYITKTGRRNDGLDLISDWLDYHSDAVASYVWNDTDFQDIDPATTDYLLGLFEPSHMMYDALRTGEPSLADMVDKAIGILQKETKGYFLLVEGGRIDHSHHKGKGYHALKDGIAFEEAIKKAGELASDDDTLTIVTADHSFAFNILGYPSRGNPILGLNDLETDQDGLPFTTLSYPDGRGAAPVLQSIIDTGLRPNLTGVDTEAKSFVQQSLINNKFSGHDGSDVTIYAKGCMAHLIHSTHEDTYLFHAMKHAACIGDAPASCTNNRYRHGTRT